MLHKNSLFQRYKDKIIHLDAFDKQIIQSDIFSLHQDSEIQICYAPHNEYINESAKILIVGITPGWSQTKRAFQTAYESLNIGCQDEEVCRRCKINARFAGEMRSNLVSMLDKLKLHNRLNINSCNELFSEKGNLLHTTSLIRYPCFYKGKNYGGVPAIKSLNVLKKYVENQFMEELICMKDIRLIIPLGVAVERIFLDEGFAMYIKDYKVLYGFPHPSGINGGRKKQFSKNYESMHNIIAACEF